MEFRDGTIHFGDDELDELGGDSQYLVDPFDEDEMRAYFLNDIAIDRLTQILFNDLLYHFAREGLSTNILVEMVPTILKYAQEVRGVMFSMYQDEFKHPMVRAYVDINYMDEALPWDDDILEIDFDDLLGGDFLDGF